MGTAERKEREKEKRRNDIIDAAEQVFFTRGIQNSTMDDVAEKAELSKGTLYLYFRSKEDLQFAICVRGADVMNQRMRSVISPDRTGYENLLAIGQATIRFAREYPDHFQTFLHFQSVDIEKANIGQEQYQRYIREEAPMAIVEECVGQGIMDQSLRQDIPLEILSTTLWSQMIGILIVAHKKADLFEMYGVTEEQVLKTHFELLTHGTLNKETS